MSKHIYGCIPTPSAKKARYRVFDAPHFTLPQDLDMRNLQPPVVDQGSLGCHDDKTEVLTESGWKPWNAYDGHDSLATVNPLTHAFEYQHPTALFRYVYEGPMYFADHRSLDCAVTPNHRMYIRPRKSAGFGFETADSIPSIAGLLAAPRGWTGIDLRGLRIGKYELSGDDLISLAALVISDGWISDSEAKENRVGGFCCFNDGRYNIIASLAQRLGIYESAPRKWTFFSAELANWFRESCGCNGRSASAKRVPGIIRFASQRQIKLFLSFFGDQTHTGKRPHQFFSTSDGMIDDLQELLLKCGNRSSIYRAELRAPAVRNDGVPIVSRSSERYLTQWETDHLNLKPRETFKPDYYKGEVFCASVPNSILITRRSGSILISGNSCTANGTCEELEAQALAQGEPLTMRSRLFVYYCSRVIEGTVPQDAGATIPDGIAAVQTQGACSETEWPYDISQFAVQPPEVLCRRLAVPCVGRAECQSGLDGSEDGSGLWQLDYITSPRGANRSSARAGDRYLSVRFVRVGCRGGERRRTYARSEREPIRGALRASGRLHGQWLGRHSAAELHHAELVGNGLGQARVRLDSLRLHPRRKSMYGCLADLSGVLGGGMAFGESAGEQAAQTVATAGEKIEGDFMTRLEAVVSQLVALVDRLDGATVTSTIKLGAKQ